MAFFCLFPALFQQNSRAPCRQRGDETDGIVGVIQCELRLGLWKNEKLTSWESDGSEWVGLAPTRTVIHEPTTERDGMLGAILEFDPLAISPRRRIGQHFGEDHPGEGGRDANGKRWWQYLSRVGIACCLSEDRNHKDLFHRSTTLIHCPKNDGVGPESPLRMRTGVAGGGRKPIPKI